MAEDKDKTTASSGAPGSSNNRKLSTEGFLGILFAVIALGVMFWVGVRLMEPYPGGMAPEDAVREAHSELGQELTDSTNSAESALDPLSSEGANQSPSNPGSPSPVDASASTLAGNKKDPICGMDPYRSPTRVEAEFSDGAKVAQVSLSCYFQYLEERAKEGVTPVRERVVTFDTWQSTTPKLVEARSAVWLIDIDGVPQGSMPPGVVAFATPADAKKFMPDLGGRVVDYDAMKEFVLDYLES